MQMPDIIIQGWGFDVHKPGTILGPRTLPDYDFIWVIDGEIEWEWENQQHLAPAGSLLLARSGMRDTVRWNRQVSTRNFFLHFEMPVQEHLPPERHWPLIRVLPDDDIARPLLRHLAAVLERRGPHWEIIAAHSLRLLVSAFVLDALATTDGQHARLSPVVERVIRHVTTQWPRLGSGTLSLDELATAAEVSRESLCRIFRKEIGCPPIEALRQVRLDRAATLLRRSTVSIAEIAIQAGFSDQFHFSRRFTEHYGQPPSEFRRHPEPASATLTPGVQALARRLWEELGNPD
jgi:AraC family transcriptional regulator